MSKDYFKQRMIDELGFDPDEERFPVDLQPDAPEGGRQQHPLFWPDDDGNIRIGVLRPHGELVEYAVKNKQGARRYRPFSIIRYHPDNVFKGKYMPCTTGMGAWPWISPCAVDRFNAGKKIEALVITEGYFKAYALSKHGVPAIGIPGITVWKEKGDGQVFHYIRQVVEKCRPGRIIFLTDADTRTIEYKPGKDLYDRPNSFYTSVKLFKKLFSDFNSDLYYKHIQRGRSFKGIDDLLIGRSDDTEAIINELLQVNEDPAIYFHHINVSTATFYQLREHFMINSKSSFYEFYKDELDDKEFVWRNGEYRYDPEAEELETIRTPESSRYMYIGNNIYQRIAMPSQYSDRAEPMISEVSKATIQKQHGRKKGNQIIKDMPYYHGRVNLPSHRNFEKEVRVEVSGEVTRLYNSYHEVTHTPREGKCPHSIGMLKHIFGTEPISWKGQTFPAWHLGADYMKLLWERPKQKLPILVLVSEDRETGKTTMFDWERQIFQKNVKEVHTEQLTSKFTDYWASALVAYIDEALIERAEAIERLKNISTNRKISAEAKHVNARESDCYIKIQLASNNTRGFAKIESKETRFWVREVPRLPADQQQPDMLERLTNEIPAFLHWLESRQMTTQRESRHWFRYELIQTDALEEVKENSRWGIEKEVQDMLEEKFTFSGVGFFEMSARDIRREIDPYNNRREIDYDTFLRNKWGKTKWPYCKEYRFPYKDEEESFEGMEYAVKWKDKNSRPYKFYASQFYEFDKLVRFMNTEALKELEGELLKDNEDPFWDPTIAPADLMQLPEVQKYREYDDDEFTHLKELIEIAGDFRHFIQLIDQDIRKVEQSEEEDFVRKSNSDK